MAYQDFMSKVRHWDTRSAKWITRHFYLLFFELFLIVLFLTFFANIFRVIDAHVLTSPENAIETLLLAQSWNSVILTALIFLNSFWMLYIFNTLLRVQGVLREINFNLFRKKGPQQHPSR